MANRLSIFVCAVQLIAVTVFGLMSSPAEGALTFNFEGKVYDLKDRSKLMFNQKNEYEIIGTTKTYYNTVSDLQGTVLVAEKTVVSLDGGKETLVSFEQDQRQISTKGNLEIRDGKAMFTFVKDGKTKTDDEKFSDDFIVTSTLVGFLQARWSDVMKGETMNARLAVLDRQETVGFQFKKESDKEINGTPGLVLKMKPSSVIISALVNPLFFSFSADGKHLLALEGRTSVKLNVDGKFKDFDGYTEYNHTAPVAAPITVPAETPAAVKPAKKKKK